MLDTQRDNGTSLNRPGGDTEDIRDTGSNIQVVVRARALKEEERSVDVAVSLDDDTHPTEITVLDKRTRTYKFDRVYGPETKQVTIYDEVVEPLLSKVILGYNCTIFAYGQTGTGKTYTMSGGIEKGDQYLRIRENTGIIPRVLSQLFARLDRDKRASTVKVSFTEIYCERVFDLFRNDHEDLPIVLDMETGGSKVKGLQEHYVTSAEDALRFLEIGTMRRSVASTNLNKTSSRSHAIFSITVIITTKKDGEDYLTTSKLNLVDLAGSENIGRSGATEIRAKEAGKINRSLLNLGKVITKLVSKSSHIPYRDSKLTRILQDSLGGNTMTCIIATVSPMRVNADETTSTLVYAQRSKDIRNKPIINQRPAKVDYLRLMKENADLRERLSRLGPGVQAYQDLSNTNAEAATRLRDELERKKQEKRAWRQEEEEKMGELRGRVKEMGTGLLGEAEALFEDAGLVEEGLERLWERWEEEEGMVREMTEELGDMVQVATEGRDGAQEDVERVEELLERMRKVGRRTREEVRRGIAQMARHMRGSMREGKRASLHTLEARTEEVEGAVRGSVGQVLEAMDHLTEARAWQAEREEGQRRALEEGVRTVQGETVRLMEEFQEAMMRKAQEVQVALDQHWTDLIRSGHQSASEAQEVAIEDLAKTTDILGKAFHPDGESEDEEAGRTERGAIPLTRAMSRLRESLRETLKACDDPKGGAGAGVEGEDAAQVKEALEQASRMEAEMANDWMALKGRLEEQKGLFHHMEERLQMEMQTGKRIIEQTDGGGGEMRNWVGQASKRLRVRADGVQAAMVAVKELPEELYVSGGIYSDSEREDNEEEVEVAENGNANGNENDVTEEASEEQGSLEMPHTFHAISPPIPPPARILGKERR